MAALLDEAKKLGLGSTAHLEQRGVAQMNALTAAKLGLGTVTHFYGHFEPLLRDYEVQPWPDNMNYNDEQLRFGQVARLWDQIHPPGSPEWKEYLQAHIELGTIFDPTMTAYAAGRDVMRMRNADWHARYTLPSLMDFYKPNRANHGSYFFDWTLSDEIAWRNFYQVWFKLLNDYKKMGGRVTVSDDAAYIYNTWGFGYIHEMTLLQEAGFHPLEVIRAATMHGAEALHEPKGVEPRVRHRPRRDAGGPGARRSESAAEPAWCSTAPATCGSTTAPGATSGSAASATRSRTASSTTRRSCWRTSPRWSRRRRSSAGRRASETCLPGRKPSAKGDYWSRSLPRRSAKREGRWLPASGRVARPIADPDGHVEPLLLAQEAERRERADPVFGERAVEIVEARDGRGVERHDDVAFAHAGEPGRPVLLERDHQHAGRLREPMEAGHPAQQRHVLAGDAEVAAPYPPVAQQRRQH